MSYQGKDRAHTEKKPGKMTLAKTGPKRVSNDQLSSVQ